MTATALDLTIQQGDDWSKTVPVVDASGNPVTITGYNAAMMVRPFAGSDVVILSLTSSPAAGIAITATPGAVVLTITAAQSALLWAQPAVYDLELLDASVPAKVTRLLSGNFIILPAVTR